ncbi:hypothetical protein [Serratia symbiotica]|uniref:Uncharacterized protein n=1 Tax=Serratia symbiotica TaxID=138074 RepID=A0A7D5NKY4_9GAMM|nr:hypothetical protein [Serratia symbiotica]QLH62791.1 hypothetical protein SYMBAF_07345 [Serratia symbiotica]QTP15507.1 hypothetical protein GPZ83_0006405 [Serratia symbiotica]
MWFCIAARLILVVLFYKGIQNIAIILIWHGLNDAYHRRQKALARSIKLSRKQASHQGKLA